jgi:hypothetical protein
MLRSFSEGDQAGEEFEPALRRLIERSGLNIDVGEAPDGRIVYLHDGVDVLLGIDVGIRQEGARDRVVALLCDEDGVMLDVATVSWPRVSSPVFIGHHWSHGDREPRALHFSRSGISNPTEPTFLLERGRELTRVTDSRWALQARRGRWEVRPPEAKP